MSFSARVTYQAKAASIETTAKERPLKNGGYSHSHFSGTHRYGIDQCCLAEHCPPSSILSRQPPERAHSSSADARRCSKLIA